MADVPEEQQAFAHIPSIYFIRNTHIDEFSTKAGYSRYGFNQMIISYDEIKLYIEILFREAYIKSDESVDSILKYVMRANFGKLLPHLITRSIHEYFVLNVASDIPK